MEFQHEIEIGPESRRGVRRLDRSGEAARVASFAGHAKSPGRMRLAKPMLARQFRGYHKRLKALLEQNA